MAQYEQHGLQLDSRELPDHLPLYTGIWRSCQKKRRWVVCRTSRDSGVAQRPSSAARAAMRAVWGAGEAGEYLGRR